MKISNETLKPSQKIRKPFGDMTMIEHFPIVLQEVADSATSGQSTCGQCEQALQVVRRIQFFLREACLPGGVNDRQAMPLAFQDLNTLATSGQSTCGQCRQVLPLVQSVQLFMARAQTMGKGGENG